jgi:hypothetical protein
VGFRLTNQNDPNVTLGLNTLAWYCLLQQAEEFGWNPMGTVPSSDLENIGSLSIAGEGSSFSWDGIEPEYSGSLQWSYTYPEARLVLIEDALNLYEALARAFMAYEPEWTWNYDDLFPLDPFYYPGFVREARRSKPSIGALSALIDFCQLGAFTVNPF